MSNGHFETIWQIKRDFEIIFTNNDDVEVSQNNHCVVIERVPKVSNIVVSLV